MTLGNMRTLGMRINKRPKIRGANVIELLTIIVVLNVLATIALWRKAAHRPEKLKKKFLNQLLHSEPVTPKHEPPPALKKDAWGVNEKVLQFFDDFREFANVVNWWLADEHVGSAWRLQELLERPT